MTQTKLSVSSGVNSAFSAAWVGTKSPARQGKGCLWLLGHLKITIHLAPGLDCLLQMKKGLELLRAMPEWQQGEYTHERDAPSLRMGLRLRNPIAKWESCEAENAFNATLQSLGCWPLWLRGWPGAAAIQWDRTSYRTPPAPEKSKMHNSKFSFYQMHTVFSAL